MAHGNVIIWMDCDFSHPPKLIPQLVRAINDYDLAIASRYVENAKDSREFIRVLTSRLINLFANFVLSSDIRDYTSGFVTTKKHVLDKIKFSPKGHGEYCMEFLYMAKKNNFKIKEIPYTFAPRKRGKTKTMPSIFHMIKHGIVYSLMILKLRLT